LVIRNRTNGCVDSASPGYFLRNEREFFRLKSMRLHGLSAQIMAGHAALAVGVSTGGGEGRGQPRARCELGSRMTPFAGNAIRCVLRDNWAWIEGFIPTW